MVTPSPPKRRRGSNGPNSRANGGFSPSTKQQPAYDGPPARPSPSFQPESSSAVFGLVRIKSPDGYKQPPEMLAVRPGDAVLLTKNGIIGRNISSAASAAKKSFRNNKIDLGIPNTASGFSRKQLEVLSLNPLRMRQLKTAINPICVYRFDRLAGKMLEKRRVIKAAQVFDLNVGDCLMMDHYLLNTPNHPRHVFRVVRVKGITYTRRRMPQLPANKIVDLSNTISSLVVDNSAVEKPHLRTAIPGRNSQMPSSLETLVDLDSDREQRCVGEEASIERRKNASKPGGIIELDSSGDDRKNDCDGASKSSKPNNKHPTGSAVSSGGNNEIQGNEGSENSTKDAGENWEHHGEDFERTVVEKRKIDTEDLGIDEEPECRERKNVKSPQQEVRVDPPVIGQDFRIHMKCRSELLDKEYYSWWPAKVKQVKKMGKNLFNVTFAFLDRREDMFQYPSSIIQRLDTKSDCRAAYAYLPGGEREEVMDLNPGPKDLSMGDLVDAFYQNGMEDGCWFRGRIAAISTCKQFATILYDDNDLELVPIGEGFIHLVEKGYCDLRWLLGLSVTNRVVPVDQRGGLAAKARKGEITGSSSTTTENETEPLVLLEVTFNDGTRADVSYSEAMHYLFGPTRRRKKREWPAPAKHRKREFDANEKGKEKENPKRRRVKKEKYVFNAEEWDFGKHDNGEETVSKRSISEINPTLANRIWRALNTAEPKNATELLLAATLRNGRGFNQYLAEKLIGLFLEGPKSEGQVFPDPNRVGLVSEVVAQISTSGWLMEDFVDKCCPKTWERFLEFTTKMSVQSYCTQIGEAEPSAKLAADSLCLSASAAEVLATMLLWKAVDLVEAKENSVEKCRETCFAQLMLDNPDGIRDATREVISIYVNAFMKCGRVLAAEQAGGDSNTLRLRGASRSYLQSLGRLTSCALWLYLSLDPGRVKKGDCIDIMKQCWDVGVGSASISLPLKLRFVQMLGHQAGPVFTSFIRQIQAVLSCRLGVEAEYKMIT